MDDPTPERSVADFYRDKCVFLTGATGFLGKVTLEKILRSCPQVDSVYCLMRHKRNQDPKTRFNEFIKNAIFDRLRTENLEALKKIQLVQGDIVEDGLGITAEDRALLVHKVNVVIHSAATVKFTDTMKVTLQMNTMGTRKIIELCNEIKNLQAFIYVSTFYSNAPLNSFKEEVYIPKIDISELDQIFAKLPDDARDDKNIIGNHPNTYTFTKSIAEYLVQMEAKGIPTAIVRPPIITGALSEPYPGWVDNYAAVTGLMVGQHVGAYRTTIADSKCRAELVPVDLIANALIVAAANLHKFSSLETPVVFNCSTSISSPLTWGKVVDNILSSSHKHPTKYAQFYPSCTTRTNPITHALVEFLLHFLPAFLGDAYTNLVGKKPRAVKMYHLTKQLAASGRFVATNEWTFEAANFLSLAKMISKSDRERFVICCNAMDWEEYFDNYIKGVNRFLLKDESSHTSRQKKLQKLYYSMIVMRCCGVALLLYIVINAFFLIFNSF